MTAAEQSLVNILAASFCRKDSPNEHDDIELHRIHMAWLWSTGQWVMITNKKTKQLLGWSAFYLTDESSLPLFDSDGFTESIKKGEPLNLTSGDHIYIAYGITMPWAPSSTYRQLFKMVKDINPKSKTISANLVKRNGSSQFFQRTLN